MTSIRCSRTLKSGIAVVVSGSLFLGSAGWPATRAFAQALGAARAGEAGAVRVAPGLGAGVSPVAPISFGAASLGNSLSAPSLPTQFAPAPAIAAPAAAPSAAPALTRSFSPAASAPEVTPSANPEKAPAATPAATPSASETSVPAKGDQGPRWVESNPGKDAPAADAGPRWVAPAKGGVKAWLKDHLVFWAHADAAASSREFDGTATRGALNANAPAVSGAESAKAAALAKGSATDRVVNDYSIPTPEAARRVAEIRHEHGTPLWAKVVAPIAVIAAGVAAIHFGAVGVVTLGAGLLVSVLAHEVAHIAVLSALGDKTAEHAGSHSLNPFHHIDAVKTIIVPAISLALSSAFLPFPILIGSGKPVDADFNNLRGPLGGPRSARNAFWVAAAGPLTNFAIAGLALGAAALLPAGGLLAGVAIGLAHMNVALGVFNLIPLPQLDGGKMLASVLPEKFYAKWVYNPKVEKGYQGLFRHLYEGPTNLLTIVAEKLGVQDQKTLNRVANGVTFAALAAFYAVAYIHFSVAVPLLFLALPCTYDYWCIREKVRSEAAVKDVMDIFSQWSSVIAQIAEDRGMASEVSQFEAEHAMKNALETLVDEMMAKEDFRALSNDEKIAKLMAAYPDKAADFLKDKVFTEDADTKEKILELLKDERNTPFYERLRRWFAEHEIFDRWDNPKYEGKLRDQMKEADKPKANGQRGSTTLGMLGFLALAGGASLLMGHAAPLLAGLGLLGVMGTLNDQNAGAPDWTSKLRPRPGDVSHNVHVRFETGISAEVVRQTMARYQGATAIGAGTRVVYRVPATSDEEGAEVARALAALSTIDMVSVPNSIHERLTRGTAVAQADGSGDSAEDANQGSLFEAPAETPAATPAASETPAPVAAETPAPAVEAPAPAAPTAESVAAEKETGDWTAKIKVGEGLEERSLKLALTSGLTEEVRDALRKLVHDHEKVTAATLEDDGTMSVTMRFNGDDYAETAKDLAGLAAVRSVTASAAVRDRLFATKAPAKVESHGKEHWSTGTALVNFPAGTPEATIKEVLARHGQKSIFRVGDAYAVITPSAEKAAEAAKALAAEAETATVGVHPNVLALLENRVKVPYAEAESYDPVQGVLIKFKTGTAEAAMKEYADARRLRLVYPKFRGGENLALLEVLHNGDAVATRQMLIDETLDEGSIVESVKPVKEQPGEAEQVPTQAAKDRAAARKAAAEAVEAAKNQVPRRDVAAEWLNFLQTRKLQDGTTLTDKQVQLLAEFLKPVAKPAGESRPPVVARTEEVKRMLPIVTSPRGMRNSVILVGGAGVGKTAVAEGLAEMIEDAEHASANDADQFLQFQRLKGRWLVELDINKILSSDEPVKVLNAILDFLPRFNDPNPSRGNELIVLMDEIQKFFLDNNGQKIANVLKGPLRDGKISVIATTTDSEYKKFIENDDAFRRRLEKIEVGEPTVEQTTRMLRAMKAWLQKIHDAIIPDATLVSAAKLTDQFDKTNFNPDKAIKAVQDGAELSRPENLRAAITLDIRETWNELVVATNEARQALLDKGIASTLALPIEMYNRVVELIKKSEALYAEREAVADGKGVVSVEVVKRVIAEKTGIGSGQLNLAEEDAARYVKMEEEVGQRVVNQERAIRAIADAIRRNKAGLSNPNRPMGKFLLVGPTGVGKTYLAKELARFLFNDPEAMVRFDMSEFMEEHSAMRLTGAPPSYVGYGEGGQLTEAVRKKPYSVILFDEVEKAHPKVFDLLLQILDDGRLTDGEGRTVDFKNTVILMTSNAGMAAVDGPEFVRRIRAAKAAGDDAKAALIEKEWDADIDGQVAEAIHGRFRPEFLNRLDDGPTDEDASAGPRDDSKKVKWIRVNRLRQQDMRTIAKLQIKEFTHLLSDRHDTDLVVDPSVIEFLSEEGFSPLYGARPMTGAIEKHIIDPLAKWILEEAAAGNKTIRGGLIKVNMKDGKVAFTAEPKPAKDIQRAVVADAAAQMAAEVFSMIERLAGEGDGEEPSEGAFDKLLRAARPAAAPADASAAPAVETPRAFFAPDASLTMPEGARSVAAEHNRAKAADPAARAEIKALTESVATAGFADAAAALTVPAGQPGEGWLKQMVAYAKERAEKAGVAPVSIVSSVDGDRVRVLIHSDAELSDADKAYLAAHFTGNPPASYEAAQQVVDNLNLNSGMTRNHNLLDLYRRLRGVPGSRMGWASGANARGGKGSDLWLEVKKETPKPVEAPKAAVAAKDPSATPHQLREMDKTRGLLMRFIDQSRLPLSEQDGTAIRVAAAEGYARLATKDDLEVARGWIAEHKWAQPGVGQITLTSQIALAMTAALIVKRFGGKEDIQVLEAMSAKLTDYSHYYVPLHNALVDALAALYAQTGVTEVRAAAVRAAQIKSGDGDKNDRDVLNAIGRALGKVGYPADYDDIKKDGTGLADLYVRMGKADELRAEFYDNAKWDKMDSARRMAVMTLIGRDPNPSDKTFELLRDILLAKRGADRVARYVAAQAWADLVARGARTKGLADAMVSFQKTRSLSTYESNSPWAALYAYVLTTEQAGGPEVLAPLETLMKNDPNSMSSDYEQVYFSAPEAWAKALVRNGLFAEYSKRTLGADGAPQPSKIEQMLLVKDRPMLVAAALRAIALARDPSFKPGADGAAGEHPSITPGPVQHSGGGGGFHGGFGWGGRHGFLPRFERDLPPML